MAVRTVQERQEAGLAALAEANDRHAEAMQRGKVRKAKKPLSQRKDIPSWAKGQWFAGGAASAERPQWMIDRDG